MQDRGLEPGEVRVDTLDLRSFLAHFPDLVGGNYNLKKIEKRFEQLRVGERILQTRDVEFIFSESPYGKWAELPPNSQLELKLQKVRLRFAPLPDRREAIVERLLEVFRSIFTASVILRFVNPTEFGVFSTPVMDLLQVRGPDLATSYVAYCGELRLWQKEFHMESVAETERALWCYHKAIEMQQDPEDLTKAQRLFETSDFVLRRRAFHTMGPLLKKKRLDLALAISELDPRLSALIAGCEYERLLKRAAAKQMYRPKEKEWRADPALRTLNLAQGVRIDLDEVWNLRNEAVHGLARLDAISVERMIGHIRRHCGSWDS